MRPRPWLLEDRHEHQRVGPQVFDGPFTDFVLAFVARLSDVAPHHGIDPALLEYLKPEDLNELPERGEIGPVNPSFELF
ncbi:hypothetical protein [Streptomyces sp. NRRL F-2580]|uniref:hypothetical protein n=1 Tax=Streptomyces sp. NRRL F-2580 TaxID=1463841 RepID=UPI0004C5A6D9|nr:hypothetical protein [Streptomyces sp. NRRL F-2580]